MLEATIMASLAAHPIRDVEWSRVWRTSIRWPGSHRFSLPYFEKPRPCRRPHAPLTRRGSSSWHHLHLTSQLFSRPFRIRRGGSSSVLASWMLMIWLREMQAWRSRWTKMRCSNMTWH